MWNVKTSRQSFLDAPECLTRLEVEYRQESNLHDEYSCRLFIMHELHTFVPKIDFGEYQYFRAELFSNFDYLSNAVSLSFLIVI